MRLSDSIESFIKAMITQEEPEVELKRNELAEYFKCAPSQINYVLATRFTVDDGYVTESRRGGGGYIRIVRVVQSSGQRLSYLVQERIGDSITQGEAARIIAQLQGQGTLSPCEASVMQAAVSEAALSIPVPEAVKNAARAKTLKAMLLAVARQNRKAPEDAGMA